MNSYPRQIICVHAPKGGVGATSVAVQLASTYRQMALSVALLDLDAQGDCALMTGVDPLGELLGGALSHLRRVDDQLFVLPSSGHPRPAMDLEMVASLLKWMIQNFDVVICDTASYHCDATLAALGLASSVLLVTDETQASLGAVDHVKKTGRLGAPPVVVYNRVGGRRLKARQKAGYTALEADESLAGRLEAGEMACNLKSANGKQLQDLAVKILGPPLKIRPRRSEAHPEIAATQGAAPLQ